MPEFVKYCDLCGSDALVEVYRKPDEIFHPDEQFVVVACRQCGLGFVNPRPSPSEIGRYYPPAFYDEFERAESGHERRYDRESSYVEKYSPLVAGKAILDVGSANGGFPILMKRKGWNVECVEPLGTKEIEGIKVFRTFLPDIPIDAPAYDVVTMWAVLEHVHCPSLYFNKVARILKKGGFLVCLVTNFESVASRRLFVEDIPRHLFFFTESTFRKYAENNGMRIVASHYNGDIYRMVPSNILFYLKARLLGREFTYDDLVRLRPSTSIAGKLRTAVGHPLAMLDCVVARILEQIEIMRRSYGIVIHVAQKN